MSGPPEPNRTPLVCNILQWGPAGPRETHAQVGCVHGTQGQRASRERITASQFPLTDLPRGADSSPRAPETVASRERIAASPIPRRTREPAPKGVKRTGSRIIPGGYTSAPPFYQKILPKSKCNTKPTSSLPRKTVGHIHS